MDREITIKNGETEITINDKKISVVSPAITVISDGESTSVTTVSKNNICAYCIDEHFKENLENFIREADRRTKATGKPLFQYRGRENDLRQHKIHLQGEGRYRIQNGR